MEENGEGGLIPPKRQPEPATAEGAGVAGGVSLSADTATEPDATFLKSFALDRMNHLKTLTLRHFKRVEDIDRTALFKDSFGIWNDPAIPVEEILLKYDALDGAFLKTFPLHTTQEIVEETAESLTLRVRLRITNDFVMELLKRSRSVEVLQPLSLRRRLHEVYAEALKRNAPAASAPLQAKAPDPRPKRRPGRPTA